jgi:tetratricopeptide (TPR) repeat protein
LWQVPVFLAGIAAVVAACVARPPGYDPERNRFNGDLSAMRAALESPHPDPAQALALGQSLLGRSKLYPEQAGEIHFLVGSSYLLLAAQTPSDRRMEVLQQARSHLEQAAQRGDVHQSTLSEADTSRLRYRLGKVLFQTGADPQRVIEYLATAVEQGADRRAEGYAILCNAYLKLPVPNVTAALQANQQQLALATEEDEAVLASARLLRGELLLRVQQMDEARKVLARIGPPAPPEIVARALQLRAESLQREKLWQEAAERWQELLSKEGSGVTGRGSAHEQGTDAPRSQHPSPLTPVAAYQLGVCYRELHRFVEALKEWEKVLPAAGEVRQAAALRMGEVRLLEHNAAGGLKSYEEALQAVGSSNGYHNSLLELTEARRLIEEGYRLCLSTADYDHAHALAVLLGKLSPPGGNQERLGQVAEAWAQDCRQRARQAQGPDAGRLDNEAAEHFREAGTAYAALADTLRGRAEEADWLRRSADQYMLAYEPARALAVLERYLKMERAPARLGDGWFQVGEARRALREAGPARIAFRKCIEYPGPAAFHARLRLAQDLIDQKNWEEAEESLTQNLELMRQGPDSETYEQTLFILAELRLQRQSYRLAALSLQEWLERYPGHSNSTLARSRLADCYRRLAATEDQMLHKDAYQTPESQVHHREQRKLWLQKAAAHYQKLAEDLAPLQAADPACDKYPGILRHAEVGVAECQFELNHYQDAVRSYERLVERYPNDAECLPALKQITRCYWILRDRDKARATIGRVKTTLGKLPDAALKTLQDLQSRKEWEEWIDWAESQ